jgi:hypothetical protein
MVELKGLIIDNPKDGIFRVHRSAMTSPEILQMEQERVFNKCWLYLCHESEVENPGDYRRRNVGPVGPFSSCVVAMAGCVFS